MVAVDEQGKPRQVPPLNLNNDWKRCRFEAAEQRKVLRLQEHHHPSCSIYKRRHPQVKPIYLPDDRSGDHFYISYLNLNKYISIIMY